MPEGFYLFFSAPQKKIDIFSEIEVSLCLEHVAQEDSFNLLRCATLLRLDLSNHHFSGNLSYKIV